MPTLYMLVGVPATGKSTWLESNRQGGVVLSTDSYIDAAAQQQGKTYNEVFKSEVGAATSRMKQDLRRAVAADEDIYWDQTNLTAKNRAGKLSKIPDHYRKVAVVFEVPSREEWLRRLDNRPGKTIPRDVLVNMLKSFEMPTRAEGFDEIKGAN